MEQENEKDEVEHTAEASTKSHSSENKKKALKAKSKISKKSQGSETKKDKSTLQVRRRNRKKKNSVSEGNLESSYNKEQDAKKLKSKEEREQKNAIKEERIEKKEEKTDGSDRSQKKPRTEKKRGEPEKSSRNQKNNEKKEENTDGLDRSQKKPRTEKKRGEPEKSSRNQKNNEKKEENTDGLDRSQKKPRTEKKRGELEKSSRNQKNNEKKEEKTDGSDRSQKKPRTEKKRGEPEKSLRNQKNNEKRDDLEKSQNDKKKEKLGGLIFMCSAKTKPDCFQYRVMGVSMSKKDLVLSVKPGLKLFLYDFDLKLLYGIYRASSSGGMKLEPKAFGGAFPVQVRFIVHTDCYPLPESIFKKAIKENYNERHKFKTELTGRQVRKLMELFRPAAVRSTAPPIRSPPRATIQDREVYEGVRESRLHSSRETFARGPYANGDARSYPVLSHERDQLMAYGEVASTQREEIHRSLYLTEKEYRAYGLQGERKNLTPRHVVPTLDTFQRGHEREHLLRHPEPVHRDTVSEPRESIRVDPLYFTEREYQPYNVGARLELPSPVPPAVATASTAGAAALDTYTRDQYYSHYYGASSLDRYLPPPRREEVSLGSYYVGGRRETYPIETDQVDKLYSTYAAGALSDYNQINHHQGPKPEALPAPVSSRYSFAGPSMYYR